MRWLTEFASAGTTAVGLVVGADTDGATVTEVDGDEVEAVTDGDLDWFDEDDDEDDDG